MKKRMKKIYKQEVKKLEIRLIKAQDISSISSNREISNSPNNSEPKPLRFTNWAQKFRLEKALENEISGKEKFERLFI